MTAILLIGNGAREHAIAKAIVRSAERPDLHVYMKAANPGLTALAASTQIGAYDDHNAVLGYAQSIQVDLAVIGPEDPLSHGIADYLEDAGIPCVGPKKALAQLETSKSFTRDLMRKHRIPGLPQYTVASTAEEAKAFLDTVEESVVKPDGLTGGKGVRVQGDHYNDKAEALLYCAQCIAKDGRVVIEEKLVGEEFSLMSFTDGTTVLDCPAVQDHKRAHEGDTGPNTGGMGSYSDADHSLPFLTEKDIKEAHEITVKTLHALKKETGLDYRGVMYGGFIATKDGVKLIEYNARLGDPEAMNVLAIMESDFCELCRAITTGHLDEYAIGFAPKATVCKYAVPDGYPENPLKGEKVEIGELPSSAEAFYASVDQTPDGLVMTGSRAIAMVGIADTITDAELVAEEAIKDVKGKVFHRTDIGTKELVEKRVKHMKALRG